MNLKKSLTKIGLSEKEARCYLQLIHLGAQSASVLSRHTKINRTSTYDILEGLIKRGLVRSIKKKGSTLFSALHPSELVDFLEREKNAAIRKIQKQQESIKDVLPELISLGHVNSDKTKVTFFEGENGMREAYEDTLSAEDGILAYANVEEMHATLPNFFPDYYKRRAQENKIPIKAIMPNNEASVQRSKFDPNEKRESRLIPADEFEFSPEVNIYNNKVLITSWKDKMAISIESEEIADFHRKMFKLCWDKAKEL